LAATSYGELLTGWPSESAPCARSRHCNMAGGGRPPVCKGLRVSAVCGGAFVCWGADLGSWLNTNFVRSVKCVDCGKFSVAWGQGFVRLHKLRWWRQQLGGSWSNCRQTVLQAELFGTESLPKVHTEVSS
jgi:hypothetical protein